MAAADYNNKVQAYFVAFLGRPATSSELAQYSEALNANTGSVWTSGLNAYLAGLAGLGTTAPTVAEAGALVTSMFQNITGTATMDMTNYNFYVGQLLSGSIKPRGLANAMLNDFGLMPRNDGTYTRPDNWVTTKTVTAEEKAALEAKVDFAGDFTAALDTPAEDQALGASPAAAKALLATVTSAATAATAASSIASTIAATVDAANTVAGQAFTLTTGVDKITDFTGGKGDDTFTANTTAGAMAFTALDAIDGAEGLDVITFNVVGDLDTVAATSSSVKNIETATLSATGSIVTNTTKWTGLTSLTASNSKNVTITAAATTDVSATSTDLNAGAGDEVTVDGGKTVSVTSAETFALANGGATSASIVVGGTTAPSGDVTITHVETVTVPGAVAAHTGTGSTIAATGGNSITVSSTASVGAGAAGDDVFTLGGITLTGNSATTAVSVTQTASRAATGTTTGITAGAVTIADGNAATASDSITTVTLREYGASTITSTVLSNLTLNGSSTDALKGSVTINQSAADASTASETLSLTLEGGHTGAISGTQSDAYETVNINTSTASTITSASFAAATEVNFTGAAATTVSAHTLDADAVISVTGTGGVTFSSALGVGVKFVGGTGNDAVTLSNNFTEAISMGGGNDTVTYGGAAGTGGSVDAGDGTDTIVMTAAQAAAADNNSTFNSKFSGFEVLQLGASGANTIVLAGINGVNYVSTSGATGALVLDGFASGGTLKLTADVGGGGSYEAKVSNALFNAADTFNLNLSKSTVLAAGSITVAGVETVNISTADASSTGSAAVKHTATLVATSATTVNVTGNNGLTLTNTGNTAITKFDASGVVVNGAADTAANLAVTFASANTTAAATVTLIGGSGADVLTGNASKDIISGGVGADIVSGGTGQDTVNVGIGRDIVRIASNSDDDVLSSDSTTAAADIVNGYVLASAIVVAEDFSTAADFQGSTAGGSNLAILSLDLTEDDGAGTDGDDLAVAIEADGTGAGQAAGVVYTVDTGILTLSGAGAENVDTLAEWLTEAAAVAATAGETVGFVFGGDTYVFSQNGAYDVLVKLVGVSAESLVLASNATQVSAGAVLIGDGI